MKKYTPYKRWTILSIIGYLIVMVLGLFLLPIRDSLSPITKDAFAALGYIILANTTMWFPITLYRLGNIDNRITTGTKVRIRSDNRIGIVKAIYDDNIMERQYDVHLTGTNVTILCSRVQLLEQSKDYGYSRQQ